VCDIPACGGYPYKSECVGLWADGDRGDLLKLLVIGSGMMGSAAAFDMARTPQVDSVTLADSDVKRAREVAARVNRITRDKKVRAVALEASDEKAASKLMRGHDAALSCVPYFLNLGLARAAVEARCHFADLGGNNTVVRQELALSKKAAARGVAVAPDCGLSPGMASILGGELVRRLGGRADALRLYVGGLPEQPTPPFHYQLVFSVEGLINEYVELARILRKGKLTTIEPLTEPEDFQIAIHTRGIARHTLPESGRESRALVVEGIRVSRVQHTCASTPDAATPEKSLLPACVARASVRYFCGVLRPGCIAHAEPLSIPQFARCWAFAAVDGSEPAGLCFGAASGRAQSRESAGVSVLDCAGRSAGCRRLEMGSGARSSRRGSLCGL